MGPQIFLAISALLWLPYGVFCAVQPEFLAGAAGVAATSTTGTIELRAMYGGLQIAIGALCGLGAFVPAWRPHALVSVGFLAAGLGGARLLGALVGAELSGYTAGGLAIEFTSAALALACFRALPRPGAATA